MSEETEKRIHRNMLIFMAIGFTFFLGAAILGIVGHKLIFGDEPQKVLVAQK